MLVQILANTPVWVFVLFVVLLAVGLMQVRPRTVRKTAAFLLPAGMIALSLAGINSSFGLQLVPVTSWLVALSLVTLAGRWWFRDDKVQYDPATSTFAIPGSWTPLVVIMAIIAVDAVGRGGSWFIDAALVLGLLGYVGTGISARLIESRGG